VVAAEVAGEAKIIEAVEARPGCGSMPHAAPPVFSRTVDDTPCVVEPIVLHCRRGHASECLTKGSAAWTISAQAARGALPRRVALRANCGSYGGVT
jgi:hypothetical protein